MVLSFLCDVRLDTMVIFQGAYKRVFKTAVAALGAALAFNFDSLYRVTQAYTFWGGDFCLIRVERVQALPVRCSGFYYEVR